MKRLRILFSILSAIVYAFIVPGTVNAQGPVAYWALNESTDSVLIDSSGNGNTAYIHTGTRVAGISGNALSFNGTSDYAHAANSISLAIVPRVSIECWVNARQLNPVSGSGQTFLRKEKAYALGIGTGGKIGFQICDTNGSWHGGWTLSKSSLLTSTWYHVVGVWDGATMKTYINGALDSTYTYSGTGPSSTKYSYGLYFGEFYESSYERFNGILDQVKVYNYALSADTILSHSKAFSTIVSIPYSPNPTYNRRPQMRWYTNSAVSTYRIQIDTNQLFTSPMISAAGTDTFYSPASDLPYDTIYWRVCNNADTSVKSTVSSVRIIHAIPTLIAYTPNPTNNRRPQLRWYTNSAISTYRIQIDTTQLFTSPMISQTTADTFYLPASNLPYDTIYWRVRNDADTLSWSTVSAVTIYALRLMAHWSFNEATDSVLIDSSGNGNTAYIHIGTRVAGLSGNALSFNGTSDYAHASHSASLTISNQITIECWVNARQVGPVSGNGQTFIRKEKAYVLGIGTGGKIGMQICDGSGSWHGGWTLSSQSIQASTWYHIAGVWDGTTMRIYINGVQDPTTYSYTGTGPSTSYTYGAYIGEFYESAYERLNGTLDELKLYNYALPAESITAHYNAIPRPVLIAYTPNPTGNWRPVLRWYGNPAIAQFRIQIATDTLFSFLLASVPTADTFYLPTFDMPLDTIFWRVANEVNTGCDFWSTRSSVIVQDSSVPAIIHYSPDPTYARRPLLTWHPGKGAASYSIQINTTPVFTTPLIADSVSDTTYTPAVDLPLGAICWHVMSKGGRQYSVPDTFTIISDSVPVLIPVKPDTQPTSRPRFTWYPASAAPSYLLQVDLAGNFATPYFSTTLTDTTYLMTSDLPIGKMFWRVGAVYSATTRYSTIDTFWIQLTGVCPGITKADRLSGPVTFNQLGRGISITYPAEKPCIFSLDIFTLTGSRIVTAGRGNVPSGIHTLVWDGKGTQGTSLPAGSYCAVFKIDKQMFSRKIVLNGR